MYFLTPANSSIYNHIRKNNIYLLNNSEIVQGKKKNALVEALPNLFSSFATHTYMPS